MFVYKILNLENQKVYVGQSSQKTLHRLQEHKSKLRSGTHENPHLQKAWNLYGESKFSIEVVEYCQTIDELNVLEESYIHKFNSTHPQYGYNICGGGNNRHMPQETKQKISNSKKGISVHTVASRALLAKYAANKVHTIESRKKRSDKLKGIVWPDTLIDSWALSHRNGIPYPILIDPTGIEHTVTNMTKFAKEHNLRQQKMSELVRGKKKSYRGWVVKPFEIK